MRDPNFLNQAAQAAQMQGMQGMPSMGGMGMGGMGNLGGLGNLGNFTPQATPASTVPPEELYATQLSQLSAMGFYSASENIRALRMVGGNVDGAVEYLLSHPPGSI